MKRIIDQKPVYEIEISRIILFGNLVSPDEYKRLILDKIGEINNNS